MTILRIVPGKYHNSPTQETTTDRRLIPVWTRDPRIGGWYENPPGTQAIAATEDELRRDLGGAPEPKRRPKPMHHMHHG
jgi:hypothetical protein